jgi:SNF2 family DNA or RNA helicase
MKHAPNTQGNRLLSNGLKQAFNLTRKEVDFPCEKVYENRYLELPHNVRKLYDQCEREFLIDYKGKTFDLKTLWYIQKVIWMRLLTSGLLDGKCIWREKLNAVKEIVGATSEAVIIWATYKDEFAILKKTFRNALFINGEILPRNRTEILKRFERNGGVIILQPDCFKFGANLSKASVMIYFSQPNSLITKTQTEDRCVHLTKFNPIMIYNIIVKNSIDEDIIQAFEDKREDSKRLRRLCGMLK